MDRISSRELAEWQAFEQAFGPLGREYEHEALASIHEQLQFLCRMTGAQFGDENPIPAPSRFPRPPDILGASKSTDDGLSIEEFNEHL